VGLDELAAAFDDGSSAEALDDDLLDEGMREDEKHVVEARDGWPDPADDDQDVEDGQAEFGSSSDLDGT